MAAGWQLTHLARVARRARHAPSGPVHGLPGPTEAREAAETFDRWGRAQEGPARRLRFLLRDDPPAGTTRDRLEALQVVVTGTARGCALAAAALRRFAATLDHGRADGTPRHGTAAMLRRGLADATSHALLAGHPAPEGWPVLDAVVLTAQGAAERPDAAVLSDDAWAGFATRLAGASTEVRGRLLDAMGRAGTPTGRALVAKSFAGAGTLDQVDALARSLAEDPGLAGRLVLLTTATTSPDFAQTDATTCGSTSLVRLLARHDPLLSLWLLTGRRTPGHTPPFLARMPSSGWRAATVASRIAEAQRQMHATTSGRHWPQALGTTPWDALRALRGAHAITGTRYRGRWLDDQDAEGLTERLTVVATAATAGRPVPMYVGGEANPTDPRSYADAVPRHVVLVDGYTEGRFRVFDPRDGTTSSVPETQLLGGRGEARAALGGWPHPMWVALPDDHHRPADDDPWADHLALLGTALAAAGLGG